MSQQKRSSVVEDVDLVLELLAPACARGAGQVEVSKTCSRWRTSRISLICDCPSSFFLRLVVLALLLPGP